MIYAQKKIIIYGSLFLCLGVLGYNISTLTNSSYLIFSRISYPFLVTQKYCTAPFINMYQRFLEYKQLSQELDFYKKSYEMLKADLVQYNALESYVKATKELREYASRYNTSYMQLAEILVKNFNAYEHFIIINKGKSSGIKSDMIAVYKNCLVGRVYEVYDYYSKVMVLTDKRCKVGAYCSKSKLSGIHQGLNQLDVTQLNFINHLEQLAADDLIVTSGQGLIFPQGFGIGYLKSFVSDGLHYHTIVKPLIDIEKIDHCYILAAGAEAAIAIEE